MQRGSLLEAPLVCSPAVEASGAMFSGASPQPAPCGTSRAAAGSGASCAAGNQLEGTWPQWPRPSEIAYSATDCPDISMQWMTRFNGGIGFHGIPVKNGEQLDTPLGVRPVSAGCIRMDDDDAKVLYDILPVGADVIVRA